MNHDDRPLRLEYLDVDQLEANPLNPKFHPPDQLAALGAHMADVGWTNALLWNEQTGRLVDGHGRKELARGRGMVPVLIGRWTPEQERKILALHDGLGYMARIDSVKWAELTEAGDLSAQIAGDSPELAALLGDLKAAGELLADKPADQADATANTPDPARPKRPAAGETPDAVWPSDNPWGIPLLLPELQADCVEFPFTLWGTQGQTKAMRGTWHFYTNDSTFDPVWANPGKPLPSGAPCLVEPNFSTHDQTPFAVALHGIYKRRWLARYWQSQGRRVFVDLNVHHSLLMPHEATAGQAPAFLGVPRGWKAYASRAHGNRPEMLDEEHAAAWQHAGGKPLFVVYGGGRRVQELSRERGWNWFPEVNDLRKGSGGAQ